MAKTTTPLPDSFVDGTPAGRIITLPIVHIDVPHPDSIPMLLLFALGLEQDISLFTRQLLPDDVMAEFPNSEAMVIRMDQQLDANGIQKYLIRNRQLWFNSLRLGVQDRKITNLIELSHKVTVRAQDRQRSRGPVIIVDEAD